jgi:hypothetical protein
MEVHGGCACRLQRLILKFRIQHAAGDGYLVTRELTYV